MAEEETPQLKKDVVPGKYRDRYKATGGTTGDFVGTELQKIGKDGLPALKAVMKENGIPAKRWETLNPGQQRMNLSNVLRSRLFKGEDITILGKQHNIRHMRDDYNGTVTDAPASVRKFLETFNMKSDDRTVKIVTRTFFPPVKADPEVKAAKAASTKAGKTKPVKPAAEAAKADA